MFDYVSSENLYTVYSTDIILNRLLMVKIKLTLVISCTIVNSKQTITGIKHTALRNGVVGIKFASILAVRSF